MSSRKKLQQTLNHQQPDSVVVDLGATPVTGLHALTIHGLRKHYGLEERPVKVHEPYQMLGLIEEDLQEAMGVDVEGIHAVETMFGFRNENWKPWKLFNGVEVLVSEHFNVTLDDDGSTLIYPKGDMSVPPSGKMPKDGYFFDSIIRQDPINEANLNHEDNCEEFGLISDENLAFYKSEIERVGQLDKGIVANFGGTGFGDIALVPAPFLKHPKGIRDISEWYMSTMMRQDYIHKIFETQLEYVIKNFEKLLPIVGDAIDVIYLCGTDFGTQSSQFCSDETFRSLYFPYYKAMNDWVHQNTSWKTFKHSCGAVWPLIPALLDAGFDILNPVQCSATDMEPARLKETFGDRVVFWGGGVDTQKTLPFGTPEEVRAEVLTRCEIFSKGGGFVFNTIHNIQGNAPLENVVACVEAVKEFNGK